MKTGSELSQIESLADSSEKTQRRMMFVQKQLLKHSNWILILDNTNSYQDILPVLPINPKVWGKGKVLITTRNVHIAQADLIKTSNTILVSELSRSEQTLLFEKVQSKCRPQGKLILSKKETQDILDLIPPYPLDTTVAAKYLSRSGISAKEYLYELSVQKKLLSQKEEALLIETSNYINTRHTIISLALDKLISENTKYQNLLLLISMLDPIQIPFDLLAQYSDANLVDKLLLDLEKSSIGEFSRGKDQLRTVSFHRSLHEHLKSHLLQISSQDLLSETIKRVKSVFESEINLGITRQNHFYVQRLIHHAETYYQWLRDSHLKVELLSAIGGAYYELGQDLKAISHLEPLLQTLTQNNLSDTLLFARVSSYLGIIAMRRGEFNKSHRYLEQSIPIYQRSTDVAGYERALIFLGHVQTLVDKFSSAHKTFRQAIQLCQFNSTDSANLARALVFHGIVYREIGSYSKALEVTEESIKVYKDGIPKMWALAYLGSIELEQGNYEVAKATLTNSVNYYKEHYANSHVSLGWILPTLASAHRKAGGYYSSILLCRKAAEIFDKTNTTNNQNLATAFPAVHIGKTYRLNGQLEQAKPYLEKGVSTHRRLFGPNNLRTKWAEMAYAQYCIDVQNYDEAEKLLTSILNYYRSCLPPTHPKIGKVFRDLSQVYLALGDIEKSDQFIQKALSILSQSFSAKHLETAHALLILGHINTEKANYELAEKALKDAHHIYERTTHPARCLTHEALSQLYYSQFVRFSKNPSSKKGVNIVNSVQKGKRYR